MIVIEYIVKNTKGEEKMRTTDEAAARDYDRMLEAAEKVMLLIESSGVELSEKQTEDLAIHLIKNSDALAEAVKGFATATRKRGPYRKNETTGNETTGNETTGNEATGNEATGNEATGNEATGNEAASTPSQVITDEQAFDALMQQSKSLSDTAKSNF